MIILALFDCLEWGGETWATGILTLAGLPLGWLSLAKSRQPGSLGRFCCKMDTVTCKSLQEMKSEFLCWKKKKKKKKGFGRFWAHCPGHGRDFLHLCGFDIGHGGRAGGCRRSSIYLVWRLRTIPQSVPLRHAVCFELKEIRKPWKQNLFLTFHCASFCSQQTIETRTPPPHSQTQNLEILLSPFCASLCENWPKRNYPVL